MDPVPQRGPDIRARVPREAIVLTRVAALCLCVLLAAAPGDAAVADYLGRTVGTVRIEIEGRASTDITLVQAVESHAGAPLSMAEVRESLVHLFALGRFEDARVEAAAEGAGVALTYQLTPIHPVSRIVFAGSLGGPGVDVAQMRRTIAERFGASPSLTHMTDMTRAVADVLRARGYLHASVVPKAELSHDPDRATLVLTVQPGVRTEIGAMTVAGAPGIPEAELLGQLGLTRGAPFERDALNGRIERYLESRRSHGYYDAKIVPDIRLSEGDRLADVTLTVNPGARVHVVFSGDPVPADRQAELAPIEREGSADEDLLEDSSNRIEEFLRGQGYRDAVAPHTREQIGGELTVTFNVRRGPSYRVARVGVSGNTSVPLDEFPAGLRVREGQPFSAARLDADVAAIEDVYRRRGFAAARVQTSVEADSTPGAAEVPVVIGLDVREGPRTLVGAIGIEGNASVPDASLRPRLGLKPGGAYFDAQLRADADMLQQAYADLGYLNASVESAAHFSADRTVADPVFTIREGPRLFVDHVLIVGNVRTSTDTITRELQIKSGDPWNPTAINESQRRLASLGLFRRTRMTELRHGDESKRDLLVTVEEAPATTIGYGGGFEVRRRVVEGAGGLATERFDVAPRASFEIGRRNLFGKNRSANLFTSVSEHVGDLPPEYRLIGTFREPRFWNTSADAFVTGSFEQQIRSSFNFTRRALNAGVAKRLNREVLVSGSYQLQRTRIFDVQTDVIDTRLVDRVFPQVLLSSFSLSAVHDTRDDQIEPTTGHYFSANGQVAARGIGSEVGFTKTFLTAQGFYTLRNVRRIVLAGSARLGVADAFPREVTTGTDGAGQPIVQDVQDLPASERFYAGGDTTVRGYPLDTLTTPATRGAVDGFPLGGNALVLLNGELRVPVRGSVGVVGFLDIGNVFARPTDIALGDLRAAVGFGIRYRSPVGPIRIDLGFKLHRDEITPGVREGLTAVHISLGQAF